MTSIARFVTNWRVEVAWFLLVFSVGVIIPAKASADGICSTEPIFFYNPEANWCEYNPPIDCYVCVVWP